MNICISPEWLVAIFTGLLVVVTAGLAVYTYRLWGATDRLVTDAKDTSQRQLRAYVSVKNGKISELSTTEHIMAKLTIINCGNTPAYALQKVSGITLAEFPLQHDIASQITSKFADGDFPKSKETLGPGAKLQMMGQFSTLLEDTHISAIKSGTSAIYFFGEIRYLDAFERPQYMKFRYFVGGGAGIEGNQFAAYQEGNEAS